LFSPLTQSQADAVYEDQVDGGYDATVAGGFDLNADGIDDIALGSHLYDFELEMGESRTFVVYGSNTRSTDAIDLTMLDGENGFRITSGLQPFASDPDRVESVGDIDANGFNDLSLNNDGNGILIVFSGKHDGAAVVDSSSLPTGMAMQIQDSAEPSQYSLTAIKVGDIDNDGIDDLGVLKPSGDAVIIYGAPEALPDSVDLADPANVELTTIKGLSDGYAWYDGRRLVALGDINTDGADDLGIGWGVRRYVSDIALIDDINEDGIEDLSISGIDTESMYLMRVLYGFPAEGFTGFLAATPNPGPAALIEAEFFDGMVGALDTAAKYAINTLNDNVSNGVDSGPTAAACLSDSSGVETAEIEQFTCSDAPLAIKYEWSGKYASSATALFSSVAYENDTLSVLKFATDPVPNGSPAPGGPSLYSVFVNYDANGVVELTNGVTTEQPLISPISCTIDVASRITSDEPENCMDLIYATTWKMAAVFGENKYVDTLTLLP